MHPAHLPELDKATLDAAASEWSHALVNGTRTLGRDEVQLLRGTAGEVCTGALVAGSDRETAIEIANAIHLQHTILGEERVPVSAVGGAATYITIQAASTSEVSHG